MSIEIRRADGASSSRVPWWPHWNCRRAFHPTCAPPCMSETPTKDHGKALVVTALGGLPIMGIGHLYVGRFGRGVALIAASVILFVTGFLYAQALPFAHNIDAVMGVGAVLVMTGVALYFLQLYDAHRITRSQPTEQPGAG